MSGSNTAGSDEETRINDVRKQKAAALSCWTCAAGVIQVFGYEGGGEGSVSIRCLYESKYQKQLKYICRGNQPSTCLQQALITSNNRQNGRFTLSHDQKSETFTVTNLNLTLKDSGSYLCGVQTDTGLDVFSAFKLEVKGQKS
uniref:Immunoglobulin V-set domain-containing protein n=1 Tax=Kryptolebias marmoratus TaxID=37003 RepID=A0A3Q2ZUE9_KRYMA